MQAAFGLIVTFLPIVIVVLVIRKFASKEHSGVSTGTEVRQLFQYLLLFGLVVVVLTGLSGLISRLFSAGDVISQGSADLARNVTFLVIGGPIAFAIASWSRRNLRNSPQEIRSFGWGTYLTLISITSLIVTMFSLHDIFLWAVGEKEFDSSTLARLLVWAPAWYLHYWIDKESKYAQSSQAHHLLGSLISLGTSAVGLARVISGGVELAIGQSEKSVIIQGVNPIYSGLAILISGALFWAMYWFGISSKSRKDSLWVGYVLLGGVGLGLGSTIISLSTILYNALVWFFGDPQNTDARTHFESAPRASGFIIAGLLSWWYHGQVLEGQEQKTRTEVRRVYEYLIAGAGLFSAVGGLTTILVALIDAITQSTSITGDGSSNTLIMAITLLLVGAPLWGYFWWKIAQSISQSPQEEHASPTRRIYLYLLFGVVGITAVINLLIAVYFFTRDLFESALSRQTLGDMKVPLGILVSSGAVAIYHWALFRNEREKVDAVLKGPRYILFVGHQDSDFARKVAQKTGARVQMWESRDHAMPQWSMEDVLSAIAPYEDQEVMVIADEAKLKAIPINRS